WLLFFRYKHVEYSKDLWWEFSLSSDAPRSLRATVGAFAFVLVYGARMLLTSARKVPAAATMLELNKAETAVRRTSVSNAALVLLGDKSVIFSEKENAFLMYAVEGITWVALGDPVGDPDEFPELIWRFRELSDQQGALCAFYQVGIGNIPYYLETDLEL